MTTREAFLERVRIAVTEGNRFSPAPALPDRHRIGYQGAGPDVVQRFCAELTTAGGQPFVAKDRDDAYRRIADILQRHQARKIAIGNGGVIDELDVAAALRSSGFDITSMDAPAALFRDSLFAADVGISNVECLVAETGSIVVATLPSNPRSLSLLPPVHIALAHPKQILADLFDLFDLYSPITDLTKPAAPPPSCLTIITGPSKTGDIELKLVTGVHGPGEVHVIICPD